jgi:MFS family permease
MFGAVGLGTLYPTTTVIIQNAVLPHQLGTATGTLNFFRQLGGAIIVAVFSAIVLNAGDTGEGGLTFDKLAAAAGVDFAASFRWVFIAAAIFLSTALVALLLIEERPLRGPASRAARPEAPEAPGRSGIAPGKACYSSHAA